MLAILRKEINSFFASTIGYLVIALFLLINGLVLWLFKGEFNILDYGFADLSPFFLLAPWVLLFLIPAITMRSFSDEKKQGTLELLLTKPISHLELVLGKYLGAFVLILLALSPTLLYSIAINDLKLDSNTIDTGRILGSYLGLLFLAAAYTAIGLFSSTLSDNQIVAFLVAVCLCLIFYIGFEGIADIAFPFFEKLGMSYHYKSISQGVLDTRDLIYFLSITTIFILLTKARITATSTWKKSVWIQRGVILTAIIVLNMGSYSLYQRFDLTKDQRYTLDQASKNLIETINSPIMVDVFLESETLNSSFRKLQTETKQLLQEFNALNSNINYSFINALEDESTRKQNLRDLDQRGLKPMQVNVYENGKQSQEVVIPWALASYNGLTIEIPLLKQKIGANQQDMVSNSVQHLEYAFADAFNKLIHPKSKKIAILQGNGQLETKYIADFLKTIRDYYYIAPFTLDSVASNPKQTLQKLSQYDLVISAKPTIAFTEKEKLVLDQYAMQGGNTMWLLDKVIMDKDSLYNTKGENVGIPRDLNLTDFFFKYGIRINPVLIADIYSAPITLALGEGSEAQFQPLQWQYSPLANSQNNHPIVRNIDMVKFDFANQIDTLKTSHSAINKTLLLQSSPLTKVLGMPKLISLEEVTKQPDPKTFNKGAQNLAVLLEGKFTSVYHNRIKPFKLNKAHNTSVPAKMIIIADGDVIKNDLGRNGPLELGFDRFSGKKFGNKEFLLNCTNYLLEDNGLINIRSKVVKFSFLDPQKIAAQKAKWQFANILLPLLLLALFGFIFNYIRRKKYSL
ncbi:MAG: gliding motility-associated ABC transporter substrate-binding protein GldG [Flavobacteriaceae bacterium]|nr:gliding motility-associated ABC transporter substrate-binding protein GldG [Flavobacteriaceae bacterium]